MTGTYIKLTVWVLQRVVVWTTYSDWKVYVDYQIWLSDATEEQLAVAEALKGNDETTIDEAEEATEEAELD